MTRFEKDYEEVKNGNALVVMKRRKEEIAKLEKEGRSCKNSFRRQCIAQEYNRLKFEYNQLDELT